MFLKRIKNNMPGKQLAIAGRTIRYNETIDLTDEQINKYINPKLFSEKINTGYLYVVHEELNLENGLHEVTIVAPNASDSHKFQYDAIDVDGFLVSYYIPGNPKEKVTDLKIGDFISCEYTASNGNAGSFANLGKATKEEIPFDGSTTPNGSFNFICVDRKPGIGGLCIADRVIQKNVSWQTLNDAGLIEGCYHGISFKNEIDPINSSLSWTDGITKTTKGFNVRFDSSKDNSGCNITKSYSQNTGYLVNRMRIRNIQQSGKTNIYFMNVARNKKNGFCTF